MGGHLIQTQSENTLVAYIKHEGGTRGFTGQIEIACILSWTGLHILALYIPDVVSCQAGALNIWIWGRGPYSRGVRGPVSQLGDDGCGPSDLQVQQQT